MDNIFGVKFGADDCMVYADYELVLFSPYTVNIEINDKSEISHIKIKFLYDHETKQKVENYLMKKGFCIVNGMCDGFMQNGEMILLIKDEKDSEDFVYLEIDIWHRAFYEKYSELKDNFIIKSISYLGIELGSSVSENLNKMEAIGNSGVYFYNSHKDKIYKIEESKFFKKRSDCISKINEIISNLEKQGMKKSKYKNKSEGIYNLYFSGANPADCYMEMNEIEEGYILKIIVKLEDICVNEDVLGFIQDGNIFHAFGFALNEKILEENISSLMKTNNAVAKYMPNAQISLINNDIVKEISIILKNSQERLVKDIEIINKNIRTHGFIRNSSNHERSIYVKDNINIVIEHKNNLSIVKVRIIKG